MRTFITLPGRVLDIDKDRETVRDENIYHPSWSRSDEACRQCSRPVDRPARLTTWDTGGCLCPDRLPRQPSPPVAPGPCCTCRTGPLCGHSVHWVSHSLLYLYLYLDGTFWNSLSQCCQEQSPPILSATISLSTVWNNLSQYCLQQFLLVLSGTISPNTVCNNFSQYCLGQSPPPTRYCM